jgi:porin
MSFRHSLLAGLVVCLCTVSAQAAPPPMTMNIDADNPSFANTGDTPQDDDVFGFLSGAQRSSTLFGNMWGVRPWLGQYGVTFGLQETSEVLGNVTGGIHQGADYDGLTQMNVQMDTQRAFGWYGGTFNASALQIHGRSLSADNLGTLQTASGIEADRATRLWELWYDQKMLPEDRLDVKVGQQSLDQEFMVSQNANMFVNTMFGWPMLPSADMPGGGPAYPLSALGVRARAKPTDQLTFMAGVFNGSPAVNNNGDSQMTNASGTGFPTNGGALMIAEMQYAYPGVGSMVSADEAAPLARVYKLGFWYDTENFPDEQFDNTGSSLALNTGAPALEHHGDYGIYAVADQMLWHSQDIDDRTLNFFTRIMGTPQADRNLVDLSLNVGLTLHEPIFGRDDDTFGIGMGYAHVSSAVTALDRAMTALGTYTPAQTGETFVEATYQYQVTPWWQLQPDFQYVFHPGAGTTNPNTGALIHNEAVIGLRTNILF